MKKYYQMIVILFVFIFLVSLIFSVQLDFEEAQGVRYIAPRTSVEKISARLFFPKNNKLRSELREIKVVNNEYAKYILLELQDGPRSLLREPLLDGTVSFRSVEVESGIAYVDIDKFSFESHLFDDSNFMLTIYGIVNSLTSYEKINQVQFLIDGEVLNITKADIPLNSLLSFNGEVNYSKENTPINTIKKFTDFLARRRFDVAYEYLNEESKDQYAFGMFEELMGSHNESLEFYHRTLVFSQEIDGHLYVYERYEKNDFDLQSTDEYSKIVTWYLIKDGEEWKIDLTNFGY